MGVQSVTEGMIAGAAILACFLLTHDTELTATGAETKIDYQKDYDFYLEHLFKSSPWAIGVMEYFNKEVFTTRAALSSAPASIVPSASIPRTWEDDLLEELDNPVARAPSPTLPVFCAPSPALSNLSALSAVPAGPITQDDCIIVSTSMSISQPCAGMSSTQLQVDVSQLSLTDRDSLAAQTEPAGGKARCRGCISAQPVPAAVPDVPKPKHISARSKKPTMR
ncbi:uncharacterized protein HD556DRAFT_1435637 [Suillus plorans]|uniref:Uncharacterized protein n=1 Tax=Suillus plorans TaxID=116603 RepID=A0A9P7E3E7_9AGAM|nr:uncharacterized protein HD556DRAFT_1435637 [Suillus plorans]KAG1809903.1 hypothetical protein HD556DRAFT_1435637 [Suillus plorans]